MAVTVMEARRQVAFQFDYLLDELPLGCQDHYLDRGRPVAEREQIHLDIQLRFAECHIPNKNSAVIQVQYWC